MKERFTIYVEADDFKDAQKVAFGLSSFGNRISVGDYLMDLHRKAGTLINPEIEIKEIIVKDGGDISVVDGNGVAITNEEVTLITIPPEKSDIIKQARGKIDAMINKPVEKVPEILPEIRKEVVIDSDVGGHVYDTPESDAIKQARKKPIPADFFKPDPKKGKK